MYSLFCLILGPCTPYTEFGCRIAAAKAGLRLGTDIYDFIGHFGAGGVKGCYTYKNSSTYYGTMFYNLGAKSTWNSALYTTDISDPIPTNLDIYRPDGFDCRTESNNSCNSL